MGQVLASTPIELISVCRTILNIKNSEQMENYKKYENEPTKIVL